MNSLDSFPKTLILQHHKENLRKCSLKGLEKRADISFFTYPKNQLPVLTPYSYIVLSLDAPCLTIEDQAYGLLLLDATWRYAARMLTFVQQQNQFLYRSVPKFYKTAYPRYQTDCPDPERGLASIEALYISYTILKRPTAGLLDSYYWKNEFLNSNKIDSNFN